MIVFRALTAEDAEGVARVERESFPTPWSREDFWREASNEFACYIVACDDDNIVGFAGCWISFEEAQVTNIALLRTHRGHGLGRRLTEAMMRAAAARGAERTRCAPRTPPHCISMRVSGFPQWACARNIIKITMRTRSSCGIRSSKRVLRRIAP